MIYDIFGEVLTSIYSEIGERLYNAYDIDGTQAYTSKYDPYSIEQKWGHYGFGQGIDIYGSVVAVWDDHEYALKLRNVSDGELIASLDLEYETHGNDISFSREFYDVNDEFPLLFIDQRFYRITRNSATLIRKIKYPDKVSNVQSLNYGNAFDGNYMYAMGYKSGYLEATDNFIRIVKLDMSELTDNGDGTYTPALVSVIDRDWLPCIQGGAYHDGLIWACCGMSSPGYLYGFNTRNGDVEICINLGETGELEGLGWGYDNNACWYAFVGTVGMSKYLKISFENDDTPAPQEAFDNATTVTNTYTSSITSQPQGGCMDDEGNLITIFPSSGKFIKHNISSGVDTEYSFTPDAYGHGNGMAYNPSTEFFYVAAMKNTGEVYVFDKSFNLVDTLYARNENGTIFNCWDIAYDQKHQRFITNTGTKLYFMDDDFEYISHVNTPASAWPATAQDIETDGDFVYFINYNPNSISVLDMKGNFIKSISNTGFFGEPESMCYDWENNAYYIEGKSSYYVIRQVDFK